MNRTLPFLAAEPTRNMAADEPVPADGSYLVLATLVAGSRTYRVMAELEVGNGEGQLRFYRFEIPAREEWFAERKICLPISRPQLVPLAHRIIGAEYVLQSPVHLNQALVQEIFGGPVPPTT